MRPECLKRPRGRTSEALDARLPFTLKALAGNFRTASSRRRRSTALLDAILETLEKFFGFRHSMLLLTSEQPDRLEMIASRGYPEGGVGSEVAFGEGIIGVVAEARKPIRISGMLRADALCELRWPSAPPTRDYAGDDPAHSPARSSGSRKASSAFR